MKHAVQFLLLHIAFVQVCDCCDTPTFHYSSTANEFLVELREGGTVCLKPSNSSEEEVIKLSLENFSENYHLSTRYRFNAAQLTSECYCSCSQGRRHCQFDKADNSTLSFVKSGHGRICQSTVGHV